ncbi:hypothetical protein D3C86_1578220 [compost metagenome]
MASKASDVYRRNCLVDLPYRLSCPGAGSAKLSNDAGCLRYPRGELPDVHLRLRCVDCHGRSPRALGLSDGLVLDHVRFGVGGIRLFCSQFYHPDFGVYGNSVDGSGMGSCSRFGSSVS